MRVRIFDLPNSFDTLEREIHGISCSPAAAFAFDGRHSTACARDAAGALAIHPATFACPGEGIRKPISSMPGQAQMSVDKLVRECEECASLGLGGVILFGIPPEKDELASGAYADNGITQGAVARD